MSTKKEILDYVMNSPENTNRSVMTSLLENLEGGLPEGGNVGDVVTKTEGGSEWAAPAGDSRLPELTNEDVGKTLGVIEGINDDPIYGLVTPSAGTNVVANPTLAGSESNLTGIEIDSTKYKIPQGTSVITNPTLVGTEASLTGLQVGNTKYKVQSIEPSTISWISIYNMLGPAEANFMDYDKGLRIDMQALFNAVIPGVPSSDVDTLAAFPPLYDEAGLTSYTSSFDTTYFTLDQQYLDITGSNLWGTVSLSMMVMDADNQSMASVVYAMSISLSTLLRCITVLY